MKMKLTVNGEAIQLNHKILLISVEPRKSPLVILGSKEDPASSSPLRTLVIHYDVVGEWSMLQMGESCED